MGTHDSSMYFIPEKIITIFDLTVINKNYLFGIRYLNACRTVNILRRDVSLRNSKIGIYYGYDVPLMIIN